MLLKHLGARKEKCACSGCFTPDCGVCKYCVDMKRFGGPGKKRQRCLRRKCLSKNNKDTDKQGDTFKVCAFCM